MRLTILRGNVDAVMFHVHAEGCADVTKRKYARAEREDGEWSSLQALTEDYYCHQIEESGSTWEDGYAQDFKVFPCAAALLYTDNGFPLAQAGFKLA